MIACEIKVSARRGLTLISVYGGLGVMGKLMTVGASKGITAKYEKVTDHLRSLMVGVVRSRADKGGALASTHSMRKCVAHMGRGAMPTIWRCCQAAGVGRTHFEHGYDFLNLCSHAAAAPPNSWASALPWLRLAQPMLTCPTPPLGLCAAQVLESRRNSGGVPPAPSASTQRTLSVTLRQAASGMGMAEGSYTSAMAPPAEAGGAAGGGGGGPLAAMAGGGGSGRQLYGVELRGKRNNRVLSIAFLPPDPYARVQANCIWWSVGESRAGTGQQQ